MSAGPQEALLTLPAEIDPGARAVAAVSGGADSTALVCLLKEAGFKHITIAHLEHGQRGDASLQDAFRVVKLAGELGFDLAIERLPPASDNAKESENSLREARMDFLRRTASRIGAETIFLGHHADDQVETVLMNLFRGSGTRGLGGMQVLRKEGKLAWVRPLLELPKSRLVQYLNDQGMSWSEDASNQERLATRNRVRLDLLPSLYDIFGRDIRASILRLSKIASAEAEWMESLTALHPLPARLPVRELAIHPLALQRRILQAWLTQQGIPDCGFDQIEKARALLTASPRAAAKINLPGGKHLRRSKGLLWVQQTKATDIQQGRLDGLERCSASGC